MAGSIDNIDRSRAAMRRRIEQLNRQNARTVAELGQMLREQVELGTRLIRDDVILAVMECFRNLLQRTPYDTGRLRAGWQFTGDISDIEWKPPVGDYSEYRDNLARAIQQSIRNSVFTDTDALYVFNNVEYLLSLNAGWSKSQAGNFIDNFLVELKTQLQRAASGRAA